MVFSWMTKNDQRNRRMNAGSFNTMDHGGVALSVQDKATGLHKWCTRHLLGSQSVPVTCTASISKRPASLSQFTGRTGECLHSPPPFHCLIVFCCGTQDRRHCKRNTADGQWKNSSNMAMKSFLVLSLGECKRWIGCWLSASLSWLYLFLSTYHALAPILRPIRFEFEQEYLSKASLAQQNPWKQM